MQSPIPWRMKIAGRRLSKCDLFWHFHDFEEFKTFWPHNIYPISQMMTAKAQRVRFLLTFVLEAFYTRPKLIYDFKENTDFQPNSFINQIIQRPFWNSNRTGWITRLFFIYLKKLNNWLHFRWKKYFLFSFWLLAKFHYQYKSCLIWWLFVFLMNWCNMSLHWHFFGKCLVTNFAFKRFLALMN